MCLYINNSVSVNKKIQQQYFLNMHVALKIFELIKNRTI